MTTSAERADNIVQRLNEGQRNGYTQAFSEIRDAQRDNPNFWRQYGQQINDAVDFRQLGFNTDFQIMGLNNRGQLITSDNDGASQQMRSARRLDVVGQGQTRGEGELWGNNGRRFQQNENGQYTFTIRNGDYVDRVARDIVAHNTGRTPSEADVVRAREAIQRENNIQNIHNVPNGTTLRIPESLVNRNGAPGQPGARPGDVPPPPPPPPVPRDVPQQPGTTAPGADRTPLAQRGLRPEQSRPAAEGGVYTAFSPPGVATDAGLTRHWDTYSEGDRTNVQTRPGANNRDVTSYDTMVGVYGNRRNVSVAEEVNRTTGVMERRTVNYPQADVSFYVADGRGGSNYLENVRSATTVRDQATGQYTTTYVLRDGRTYDAVNYADGRPRFFNQRQQPGR